MTDHTPSDWIEISFELCIAIPVLAALAIGTILYTIEGINALRRRFHR